MADQWRMTGSLIGACSCEWGCPCNFDARPSQGFCEGGYSLYVKGGNYGSVPLDGLKFLWLGHSPGPLHEGNVTSIVVCDESADDRQRSALETLIEGGGVGLPFDIFASVTAKRLPTIYAPIEMHLDGIRSTVKVNGVWDVALTRIRNPVSGEEEEIYLDKPTGFTSTRAELGMSEVMRLNAGELTYDHGGKYGEYAEFSYAGP